jgi:Asp-tRNA(Asn)/Glu-tRNA(Gln) amidotransferase A subunit family amidase
MSAQVIETGEENPLRRGGLKPTEMVDYCLNRIGELDDDIRAWVYVDSAGARAAAVQLDDELAQGRSRGPLHGIPIGVKDIVDVRGMPTRAGSRLTSPAPTEHDAPAVERLRAAGAILLGKTVTTEWACFDPPPTRNPWNLAHPPGGSSSGSAAAVAMDMCVAAVGSQTGGSIIRPGSYCGVYSCKPSHGAISLEGVVPLSPDLDHLGAFARTIADLTSVVAAMMGGTPMDSPLHGDSKRRPRIGVVEEYFYDEADSEIVQLTRDAVNKLQQAGAHICSVRLPKSFSQVHSAHREMLAYRAARFHQEQFTLHASKFGPHVSAVLREGAGISAEAYQAALGLRREFQNDLTDTLADVDALLTPATPTSAPASLATTGDLKFNSPWSFSGLPVVSLPVERDRHGMPAAIQLIGRAGGDCHLLALSAWCEGAIPFRARPTRLSTTTQTRQCNGPFISGSVDY